MGVGCLIAVEGKTIYHAGDKDFIAEMKDLGDVEVALLPIRETFTMGVQQATGAAVEIRPTAVIPTHRFEADPEEFKKKAEAKSNIKVVPLQIGEVCHLK